MVSTKPDFAAIVREQEAQGKQDAIWRETVEEAFGAYCKRVLPDYLRPDAPTPATWGCGRKEWERFCDGARKWLKVKAYLDFTAKIADGFWLDEVATGELPRGTGVSVTTGRPVRQSVSETPNSLRDHATQLRSELSKAGVWLGDLEMGKLDMVIRGFASRAEAQNVVAMAESALQQARAPAPKPAPKVVGAGGLLRGN